MLILTSCAKPMKPSSWSGRAHTSPVLSVYGYSVRPASAEAHRQPTVLVRVWFRVRVRVRVTG